MRPRVPRFRHQVLGIVLLWCVLASVAGLHQSTVARQATPAASPISGACDIAPRTVTEIQALADSTSERRPLAGPLPVGTPAGPATVAAMSSLLHDMSACLTAGQMLHFYALHSDAWLRRFTAGIADLTNFTTSTPPLDDGQSAVYLGPWHARVLPDGRVMAAVLLRIGDELRPDPKRVRVLLLVREEERWLVDETIELVTVAGCASPVEVAAVVGPPPGAVFDAWSASC